MAEKTQHSFTVTEEQAGKRLDAMLAAEGIEGLSRSRIKQLMEAGHLSEAGAAVSNASRKVKAGEVFTLSIPEATPSEVKAVDMPLDILFEDEHMLVINKAAGMTVHPAPGHTEDTLVNALLAHCGDSLSGIGGVERPGIVHRLDKDTSGLMVVAKHDAAHQHLAAQLADRSLSRTYMALVWGALQPPSGTIEGNIGRSPKNRKKMAVLEIGGKEAKTHFRSMERYAALVQKGKKEVLATLVECKLETGRTHQIRVHMAHMGHPLLGDPLYGAKTSQKLARFKLEDEEKQAISGFERQALHASEIRFIHPKSGEEMSFSCNLSEDMRELVDRCKGLT